jgi:hypothetical protein
MKTRTVTDKILLTKKAEENHVHFWLTSVEAQVQLHSLLQTKCVLFFLQLTLT